MYPTIISSEGKTSRTIDYDQRLELREIPPPRIIELYFDQAHLNLKADLTATGSQVPPINHSLKEKVLF